MMTPKDLPKKYLNKLKKLEYNLHKEISELAFKYSELAVDKQTIKGLTGDQYVVYVRSLAIILLRCFGEAAGRSGLLGLMPNIVEELCHEFIINNLEEWDSQREDPSQKMVSTSIH